VCVKFLWSKIKEDIRYNTVKGCPFQFFKKLLKWTSLNLLNKKIGFAWYMEITLSRDVLKSNEISVKE
jgi:hypothetical protein